MEGQIDQRACVYIANVGPPTGSTRVWKSRFNCNSMFANLCRSLWSARLPPRLICLLPVGWRPGSTAGWSWPWSCRVEQGSCFKWTRPGVVTRRPACVQRASVHASLRANLRRNRPIGVPLAGHFQSLLLAWQQKSQLHFGQQCSPANWNAWRGHSSRSNCEICEMPTGGSD